ncbi:hypothetical protein A2U01_0078292, partial [Trifolium medium]|nr:hypothetical protein [Trifolium medium]
CAARSLVAVVPVLVSVSCAARRLVLRHSQA